MIEDKKGGFQFWPNYYRAAQSSSNPEAFVYAVARFFYDGVEPNFSNSTDSLLWDLIVPSIRCSKRQSKRNQGAPEKNHNNAKGVNQYSNPKDNPEDNPKDNPEDNQIEIELEIEKELEDRANKRTRPKFDFKSELLLLGVTEQTASDFMKVRKQKKATDTQTAFNKIKAEVSKANADGVTAEECIKMAVENSWQGFSYEWYKNRAEHEKSQGKNIFETHGPQQKPKKVIEGREIFNLYK